MEAKTTIEWLATTHEYRVTIGRQTYNVYARSSHFRTEWKFTVEGGGMMRRHVCNEDGATYKRVMAAWKASNNANNLLVG